MKIFSQVLTPHVRDRRVANRQEADPRKKQEAFSDCLISVFLVVPHPLTFFELSLERIENMQAFAEVADEVVAIAGEGGSDEVTPVAAEEQAGKKITFKQKQVPAYTIAYFFASCVTVYLSINDNLFT